MDSTLPAAPGPNEASYPRRLALFDLDHTLVPFDSGMAWTRHLIQMGAIEPEAEAQYLARCRDYVAGKIDIRQLSRFGLDLLAQFSVPRLRALRAAHEVELRASIPAAAHALVQLHRTQGDLCALVTATVRFVAQPYAQALQVPHLMATESGLRHAPGEPEPRFSGALGSAPCWGPEKPASVARWLKTQGLRWSDFPTIFVYTDALSDLPLLQQATHPVAVTPEQRLREHARAHGWRIADTLDAALLQARTAIQSITCGAGMGLE